jgi:small subunit ribosomal protein S21
VYAGENGESDGGANDGETRAKTWTRKLACLPQKPKSWAKSEAKGAFLTQVDLPILSRQAIYSARFRKRTLMVGDPVQCKPVEVEVGERGVERAIKQLKRMMASEGIMRELKKRRSYMKPSVKRRKKQSEAERNRRKRARKAAEGR